MKIRALIALSASLFLFACGGDDDGGSDTGVAYMCVGPYANRTHEAFVAGAADTGMCISESDLGAVCDADIAGLMGTCAFGCRNAGTNEQISACAMQCVKDQPATVVDPSDACIGCYLGSAFCALMNCQTECVGGGPTSEGCITCRQTAGCTATFYECSGLPVPG